MSHIMNVDMNVDMNVNMNITAGESKIDMVPAFSDGPRSVSLAWGTFLIN